MGYDKDEVKATLGVDDVFDLLDHWGAEPRWVNNTIECRTICHHPEGGGNRHLYYLSDDQDGTGVFHCFSGCDPDSFDLFSLVGKVEGLSNLNDQVNFVVDYFGLAGKVQSSEVKPLSEDFRIFKEWDAIRDAKPKRMERYEASEYDVSFLKNYPDATPDMVDVNIRPGVLRHFGVKYDPVEMCWIVPHADDQGRTIGVRQRTLDRSQEVWGKYRPWRHLGIEYAHPLGFNLFSDNHFWENLERGKTAIVFESEKAVMQYCSYEGSKNNISCAMCGSSLSDYQFSMLQAHGMETMIIGVDRDYHNLAGDDFTRYVKKIQKYWNKYDSRCNLTFMIDRKNMLGYKDAPTDRGKETFESILGDRKRLTGMDFDRWLA